MVSLVLFANPGKPIQNAHTQHNVRFRFASCAQGMISGVPLIRLVREMCQRVRTWSVLSGIFRKKLYLIHESDP